MPLQCSAQESVESEAELVGDMYLERALEQMIDELSAHEISPSEPCVADDLREGCEPMHGHKTIVAEKFLEYYSLMVVGKGLSRLSSFDP
jgi:hypothetical protein